MERHAHRTGNGHRYSHVHGDDTPGHVHGDRYDPAGPLSLGPATPDVHPSPFDEHVQPKPQPLPPESVALGPGCALRIGFPDHRGGYDFTLLDRHGSYLAHGRATIERVNNPLALGPGYLITVADLTTPGRRGRVLPVRADSDPKPESYGDPSIRTVHHAVHHSHGHDHPRDGYTESHAHAHVHAHTGADADRAGRPDHRDDPHTHTHKRGG